MFLICLKAGGFGLTLTEADYVFVLDPWWNPAAEAQAIDRTHRIGQTRPVNVYRLVSRDTIEEKVVALQERKRDLFARVVDEGALAVVGADAPTTCASCSTPERHGVAPTSCPALTSHLTYGTASTVDGVRIATDTCGSG